MTRRHGELSLAAICKGIVMSDEHEGSPLFFVQPKQQFNDRCSRGRVQISCWLIGKQDKGLRRKGARNGHTLLFTT